MVELCTPRIFPLHVSKRPLRYIFRSMAKVQLARATCGQKHSPRPFQIDLRLSQMDLRHHQIDLRLSQMDLRHRQIHLRLDKIAVRYNKIDLRLDKMAMRHRQIEMRHSITPLFFSKNAFSKKM